jgi:hypothetical protein
MPYWLDTEPWRHELGDVLAKYPGTVPISHQEGGHSTKVLRVPVTPVPKELGVVLADLNAGCTVGLIRGGAIVHWPDCPVPRDKHNELLPRLRLPTRRYLVDLAYPNRMNGTAGPIHPVVRIIKPDISARTVPLHPHLSRTTDGSDSWACPIAPHDTDWHWYPGATADYLDQIAIWLLKTDVWLATGGGLLRAATWIGADSSHVPIDVLANPENRPCRCGSGLHYGRCCRPRDFEAFLGTVRRQRGTGT